MIEQFTDVQIQQYREDGFLIVENLIDMDAVMELRGEVRPHLRWAARLGQLARRVLLAEGS